MSAIEPEWILEYFEKDLTAVDVWVEENSTIEDIFLNGSFSPRDMAKFLSEKISEHYSILE
jgi:hypothetical protein